MMHDGAGGGTGYRPPLVYLPALLRARAGTWRSAAADRLAGAVPPLTDGPTLAFVVGCANSGTTLAASRLGLHPAALTIPAETTMFRPGRRLAEARARLARWQERAAARGATCVIEKTPKHVHAIARIRRLVPDARIIVMLRNPFDTVLSLSGRPGGSLAAGLRRWVVDTAPALALPEGPGILHLRYEHLTAAPRDELARALAFLGLAWDEAVLGAGATAYAGRDHRMPTMRLRARQVAEPIRPKAGRWRQALSPDEAVLIRRRAGPLFAALGGDPESGEWRGG